MDFIYRDIVDRLRLMQQHFPVIVLSGARQVGKTTFLKRMYPDADYVVFDSIIDIENARRDPDLFLDNHRTPLILDEIQYAPEVVSALKRRLDQNRIPGSYFLTGSQQWGILRNLSESLAGRAVFLDLAPFSLAELSGATHKDCWLERYLANPDDFAMPLLPSGMQRRTLYEQMFFGWYPAAQSLPPMLVPDFYTGYLRTYIERDLRATADIDNYQQFGKFFMLAAALSGQEINSSQLGRDVGVTPQTSRRWLDLLVQTYQWLEIPSFTQNAVKRISGRAKGYVADTGFMCNALALSSPAALANHPALGAAFETAVVGEIHKLCGVMSAPPRLYHWRAHSGAEVDLILERDGMLYPIEIKLTSRPQKSDCRGILTFQKEYASQRVQTGLVLCQCEQAFMLADGVKAIPFFR